MTEPIDKLLTEVLELADDLASMRLTPEVLAIRRARLKATAVAEIDGHTLRLVPADKMDAQDPRSFARAVCSCGDYTSSVDSPNGAARAWVSHWRAKTWGIGRVPGSTLNDLSGQTIPASPDIPVTLYEDGRPVRETTVGELEENR